MSKLHQEEGRAIHKAETALDSVESLKHELIIMQSLHNVREKRIKKHERYLYNEGCIFMWFGIAVFLTSIFFDNIALFFQWQHQVGWNALQYIGMAVSMMFIFWGIIQSTTYKDD